MAAIVIKPVRINNVGNVCEAPHIICDEGLRMGEALEQARNYSGLSKYDSWNFLKYGVHQSGRIIKEPSYKKKVRHIQLRQTF